MKLVTYFLSCVLFSLAINIFPEEIHAADVRPNIIVFLIDDMGVMDTSVPFLTDNKGSPVKYPLNDFYKTPGMERMAAQGIRFSQFYAQSVCSPTRTCIVTGQNAARHHTTNWINPTQNNRGKFGPSSWNWKGLDQQSVTLPRILSEAGYVTQHVGKGHFGPQPEAGSNPLNIGFDFNIGGTAAGQPASYLGIDNYGNLPRFKNKVHAVPHLEKYHGTETFLTEALTLEAKSQLSSFVKDQKPFFLYMAHYAVHAPFMNDPRFSAIYESSDRSKQSKVFGTLISGMDKSLADIMDHVQQLGVAENTLLFFLGDNGSDAPHGPIHEIACAAPLRGKKGTHYEGGMRVPFIAAWAKPDINHPIQKKYPIIQGAVQQQVGTVMDIMPTILEVTGVQAPANHIIDGKSLTKLFNGKPDSSREEMFLMHFPHEHRSNYFTSYRKGKWKLVYHYYPEQSFAKTRYELFNLEDDPFESNNLAAKELAQLKQMTVEMTKELKREGAQFPTDDMQHDLLPVVPE